MEVRSLLSIYNQSIGALDVCAWLSSVTLAPICLSHFYVKFDFELFIVCVLFYFTLSHSDKQKQQ